MGSAGLGSQNPAAALAALPQAQGDQAVTTPCSVPPVSHSHRNEVCEQSTRTLVQNVQPGQFTFDSFRRTGGILSYVMRVAATNYKQFAMVYVEKNVRFKWHFQATLYGRTKKLSHKLKERFVKFSKSVDFTEDNIAFFVPIEECIDD
ncbi:neutrophil gelatinase-associated lipocalin-like isoform X2 [Fukomys damarensis]|uniref:neutrophil gelatinase-associated lipocalin-like isoform X2 n=1 Tax=Fukomys damarensis TaxID=885580 RepID=UPI00053FA18F|nr:neutrophil gelatinase-associated lipocalin-like isoform X2 [Fukomys damarensis]